HVRDWPRSPSEPLDQSSAAAAVGFSADHVSAGEALYCPAAAPCSAALRNFLRFCGLGPDARVNEQQSTPLSELLRRGCGLETAFCRPLAVARGRPPKCRPRRGDVARQV